MIKTILLSVLSHGLVTVAALTRCSASTVATVTLPETKPTNAVRAPGDFVGFGFEMAFLNDYANDFSNNLMNSVASRLSKKLTIRTGGTSGDLLTFDPNQTEIKVCVSGDCPIGSAASYILGPSYFNGFDIFQNFLISVQAPLSPQLNISNSVTYVNRSLEKIGDRLAAIAIGNEPDLYPGGFHVTYHLSDYLQGVDALRGNLTEQLNLNGGIFEVLDIAHLAESSNPNQITIKNAFSQGLDDPRNAKIAAVHYYQVWNKITSLLDMQASLMNHSSTVANFTAGAPQDIAYLRANFPEVKYVFSESGTGLTSPLQIQGSFGAALWLVDFQLYALSQGVARVDGTMRPAANHSLWVPDDSAPANPGPQVRAPFYAQPFVADFIGMQPGDVVEVDLGSDVLTAYASYSSVSGKLEKLALINLRAWAKGVSPGDRGSVVFAVPVQSPAGHVSVRRLRAEAGCQALGYDYAGPGENITWAGEQWSYTIDQGKGHLVTPAETSEKVLVRRKTAEIEVLDSEAVIVYFSK